MNQQKTAHKIFAGWRELFQFLQQFWSAYGGWRSFLISPYLHIAIAITAMTWPIWTQSGWWAIQLSILPSMLGFTIGGFAIVLALGTGEFGRALSSASKPDGDIFKTGLAKLGAAFTHFILMQFLGILAAILANAMFMAQPPKSIQFLSGEILRNSFWGFCWFLGIYSIALALATTHWIFSEMKLLIKYQKSQARIRAAHRECARTEDSDPV